MIKIRRFSASLEPEILDKIESYGKRHGLPTRSDALRALVRDAVLDEGWKGAENVYGIITMLYDHHGRQTMRQLASIQHDSPVKIIVTQHIHLSHHTCLEVITACGKPHQLEKLSSQMSAVLGVKRCSLSKAAVESDLA